MCVMYIHLFPYTWEATLWWSRQKMRHYADALDCRTCITMWKTPRFRPSCAHFRWKWCFATHVCWLKPNANSKNANKIFRERKENQTCSEKWRDERPTRPIKYERFLCHIFWIFNWLARCSVRSHAEGKFFRVLTHERPQHGICVEQTVCLTCFIWANTLISTEKQASIKNVRAESGVQKPI